MALCDQAIGELTEARSVEDVLDMRNVADALGVYLRKMKAAVEARSAVQTVVLLAEARIGAELKAAQDRGEIAKADGSTHHRPAEGVRQLDTLPATLPELGIPRQRAAEYRKMAAAGETRIRQVVADAEAEGRVATRNEVLETMRPVAAAAAERVADFQRKQNARPTPRHTTEADQPIEPVCGVGTTWTDWTSAVDTIGTLDADLPMLARAIVDHNPTLLAEARAALPRLTAWIAELEAVNV